MKSTCILILTILSVSCKMTKDKFSDAKFDRQISKISINSDTQPFEEMNKQERNPNMFDTTSGLKTTIVEYCKVYDFNEEEQFDCTSRYSCNAYCNKSDTLIINIGNFNGYAGDGFDARYINGKFYIQPYTWTHIEPIDKPDMVVEMKKQQITLDKFSYKSGDSIYGKIYFHAAENTNEGTVEHFAQGYFRAKINALK